MAYTPINWIETTLLDAVNFDIMDDGIVNNDSRTTDIEAGTTTTNASTYKGNDIDTNGDGKVNSAVNADNADNADKLNGKHWVLVTSGSIVVNGDSEESVFLRTGGHNYYRYSVYLDSASMGLVGGVHSTITDEFISGVFAYISKAPVGSYDELFIRNHSSTQTAHYEVYAWE